MPKLFLSLAVIRKFGFHIIAGRSKSKLPIRLSVVVFPYEPLCNSLTFYLTHFRDFDRPVSSNKSEDWLSVSGNFVCLVFSYTTFVVRQFK